MNWAGLKVKNNTIRAPSLPEAELFDSIWHQCVSISGAICWGHKCMLGKLNDYREKANSGNSSTLRGLICRDSSTTWDGKEIKDVAFGKEQERAAVSYMYKDSRACLKETLSL